MFKFQTTQSVEDLVNLQRNHVELGKEEDLQLSGEWRQICFSQLGCDTRALGHTTSHSTQITNVFVRKVFLEHRQN